MGKLTSKLAIHPMAALLLVTIDIMLFASDITGIGWILSCMVASVMTVPCILLQRSYGDDWITATGKGLALAVLTAIPGPLPSFVTGTAGIIGMCTSARKGNHPEMPD